jgi:alpha-L-rhamnosidase
MRRLSASPLLLLSLLACSAFAAGGRPTHLRCEYQTNPLALDTLQPRLSWWLSDTRRGAAQTGYQIRVASSRQALSADSPDVWDSGQISSRQSQNVLYTGPALQPGREYFWTVRTWDQASAPSEWAEPASYRVGFLSPSDWKARWIEVQRPERVISAWQQGSWIWHPQRRVDGATIYLRRTFELPPGKTVKSARVHCSADDSFVLFLNGKRVGVGDNWERTYDFDAASALQAGPNVLAATATNGAGACGFLCSLRVEFTDGSLHWVTGDASWKTAAQETAGWTGLGFADSAWTPVIVLGPYGMDPWGTGGAGTTAPLRSCLMRKEFQLPSAPVRALVSVSGLGAYELRLNGRKVGNDILTPGWTSFAKRVPYQVYDVTGQLHQGSNALGAILGNGWWKGRILGGRGRRDRDSLRLLVQLDLVFADGSTRSVATDDSWSVAPSPVYADDIYDGEAFDARLDPKGWDSPGYKDSGWAAVAISSQPMTTLVPEAKEAIQPIQDLPAVSIHEVTPGVFIFDFGQNLTGWCRLKVRGPAGTKVVLRHGEVLNPDGTLYTANLRSAKATDSYTLRGDGEEVWEPRFTYHGFRYAEVTGLPGRPSTDTLTARMICSNSPQTGCFECSNQVVNDFQHAILWGQRGNMWAVPTDCPQRDERLGWTGDAQMFANTSCWNLDMNRFYTKWLRDIRDSQGDDGAVRDVNPGGGGPAAPAWGDACIIVPYQTFRHYGDLRILQENWDCMTRWVDYMTSHLTDGLYERDGYGDWIAVVGSPKKPISAAYYYYDCVLLSKMAKALGKTADADKYAQMAAKTRDLFNARYLDPATNKYPGGTQTSYALPLFFGLVPEDRQAAVAANLAQDILKRGLHLSTGFLGTGYLNPVLSSNGYHALAWELAKQTTYPSWGYMVKQGATTVWELWNSDKAGPGMNSRNHFCLGAVGEWYYESLAGIGPEQPGFQTLHIAPQPVGDLTWVKASLDCPYGTVVSNWKLEGGDLLLDITIPANTSALVIVPTFGRSDVAISEGTTKVVQGGRSIATVAGLTLLSADANGVTFRALGGSYQLRATGVGTPPPPAFALPKPPKPLSELHDDFSGLSIDPARWEILDQGLESDAPSGLRPELLNGALRISGTTSVDYWAGKTLMSQGGFTIKPGQVLRVQVDRLNLRPEGSGARSGLWLWRDSANWLMFCQDTERGHWSYNLNGRQGTGTELLSSADPGSHRMTMIHDGDAVQLYLDAKLLAKVPVTWSEDLRVGITTQARKSGDSLEAAYSNFHARLEAK